MWRGSLALFDDALATSQASRAPGRPGPSLIDLRGLVRAACHARYHKRCGQSVIEEVNGKLKFIHANQAWRYEQTRIRQTAPGL